MKKKEMIAMLLADGQDSRLGVLTAKVAKPAVAFGGKYRIIDFPLSNCVNSGVDTVGVLTPYQSLRLNEHIGIGIPWDLDRNVGGVTILPPYEKSISNERCTGTANAVYQNLEFMESYNPDYVLVLSADHVYKMDYGEMLEFHKKNNADVTVAVTSVPDEVSMGIYIFSWTVLKNALLQKKDEPGCDIGKDIVQYCREQGQKVCTYGFDGYWKELKTLESYWEANKELADIVPEFNLYEEFWKIYTKVESLPPQYISENSAVEKSIICNGAEIHGDVHNSVIGAGVVIGKGTIVKDSIIMQDTVIGKGCIIDKAIIAENVRVGEKVIMGIGSDIPNKSKPDIYSYGLVTIGHNTVIPSYVQIGKNTEISGVTVKTDYVDGVLESGETLIKAGE